MLINRSWSCVAKENDATDAHSKNWNAKLPYIQSLQIKVVFIITIISIIIFIIIVTQ